MKKLPTLEQLQRIDESFDKSKIKIYKHVKYVDSFIYLVSYAGKYYEVYSNGSSTVMDDLPQGDFEKMKGEDIPFDKLDDITTSTIMGKFGVKYNPELSYSASSGNVLWDVLSKGNDEEVDTILDEYLVYYDIPTLNHTSKEDTARGYRLNNLLSNWSEAYNPQEHSKYKDIFGKIINAIDVSKLEKNLGKNDSVLIEMIENQTFRRKLPKQFIQFIKQVVDAGADVDKFLKLSKEKLRMFAGSFYNADDNINQLADALGVKVKDLTDISSQHKR